MPAHDPARCSTSHTRHTLRRDAVKLAANTCAGDRKVKIGYVRSLCELYDVDVPRKEFLVRLAQEADQREWWADHGNTVPEWYKYFLGFETAAQEICTYHSELFPGLLQTPDYIRAIAHDAPADEVDRAIEIRST